LVLIIVLVDAETAPPRQTLEVVGTDPSLQRCTGKRERKRLEVSEREPPEGSAEKAAAA
jgi:hypothetical protein